MTSKIMETQYYEGCGREGPLRCIFLGEFHPVAGPKISCQFPEDYVSKELFDAISAYIIPKPQLKDCTMTINALGHKIIGYPIRIDNPRYERNVYLFNLCFVCDSWSRTVQYEPVVKKLGEHLTILEEENRFVSGGSAKFPTLLAHLLHDLNTFRKATFVEGDTAIHLKVLEVRADPAPVRDCDVPVLARAAGLERARAPAAAPAAWDLTTRQLLPFVDGYNHVSKIAADANVEKTLVKACIQNLVYYGVVVLIPVLKFGNVYRATPRLSRLFGDRELQRSCLAFLGGGGREPSLSEAVAALCSLQQGTTLRTACERLRASAGAPFDVRRLIVFALAHGLLRCLQRYPVRVRGAAWAGAARAGAARAGAAPGLRGLFDGRHSADEICCLAGVDLPTLERAIDDDPDVVVVWR